jgi:hypothetical protein
MAEALHPIGAKQNVSCWIWFAGATASYAAINIMGWVPLQRRALDTAAAGDRIDPAMSAMLSTGFTFAAFWMVGILAIVLCWRRKGLARFAVLTWPVLILVLPEAMRTMPSLLTLAAGLSFGVMGVFLLAGRETQEDETPGRPPAI